MTIQESEINDSYKIDIIFSCITEVKSKEEALQIARLFRNMCEENLFDFKADVIHITPVAVPQSAH